MTTVISMMWDARSVGETSGSEVSEIGFSALRIAAVQSRSVDKLDRFFPGGAIVTEPPNQLLDDVGDGSNCTFRRFTADRDFWGDQIGARLVFRHSQRQWVEDAV
jgi:hypothetical protein